MNRRRPAGPKRLHPVPKRDAYMPKRQNHKRPQHGKGAHGRGRHGRHERHGKHGRQGRHGHGPRNMGKHIRRIAVWSAIFKMVLCAILGCNQCKLMKAFKELDSAEADAAPVAVVSQEAPRIFIQQPDQERYGSYVPPQMERHAEAQPQNRLYTLDEARTILKKEEDK
jgi:hypothetical protein